MVDFRPMLSIIVKEMAVPIKIVVFKAIFKQSVSELLISSSSIMSEGPLIRID